MQQKFFQVLLDVLTSLVLRTWHEEETVGFLTCMKDEEEDEDEHVEQGRHLHLTTDKSIEEHDEERRCCFCCCFSELARDELEENRLEHIDEEEELDVVVEMQMISVFDLSRLRSLSTCCLSCSLKQIASSCGM